jgi:HAD superfamily hydrolase (TIGR01509 family)
VAIKGRSCRTAIAFAAAGLKGKSADHLPRRAWRSAAIGVNLDISAYQGVIFDLDGTLYLQKPLRMRMMFRLAVELAPRPARWGEPHIIKAFRSLREELAVQEATSISGLQYERCARLTGASPDKVKQVAQYWLHQAPLPYLPGCRAPGIAALWQRLEARGIKLAVCSDYPIEAKLKALKLRPGVMVCSEDSEVGVLKPHPAGLLKAAGLLELQAGKCLVIGDRAERDGEAAKRAGMDFVLYAPGLAKGDGRIASYEDVKIIG